MTTAMHEKADRRRPGKSGRRLRRGAALRGLARREFFFVALLAGGLCAVALPFYLGKIAAARRSSVDRLWDAAHAALTDAHLAAVMTGQTGPAGSVIMTRSRDCSTARSSSSMVTHESPIGSQALDSASIFPSPKSLHRNLPFRTLLIVGFFLREDQDGSCFGRHTITELLHP